MCKQHEFFGLTKYKFELFLAAHIGAFDESKSNRFGSTVCDGGASLIHSLDTTT